jgi:hypothetical protein
MRLLASILAASLVVGCGTTSYQISGRELQRLASLPPEARGQSVRVVQQMSDADVGPAQPVTAETQIVIFPRPIVYDDYRRHERVSGWGQNANINPNVSAHGGGGGGGSHGGGGLNLGGSGGDGKAMAIVILVVAAVILVAAAGVEGSRYDGYVQLHPMHPLYLVGRDGSRAVMPLAWLDPQSAAFADHAIVRSTEGPWHELGRAPLDRAGFTYGMYGGVGTFSSIDGTTKLGTATTIQLGIFPEQHIGLVGSLFFGWRDNTYLKTLFETRYTAELQAYPVQAGPFHFGLYGGGGGATRIEDGATRGEGDASSAALIGGTMFQLDVNTRLALTGRLGLTYAHGERMNDAMFGLAVY